ncbi:hypothetical protein KR032_010717, partial [Drosophila birchii]
RLFFLNIPGMRTKSASSQLEYDVIILVETWLIIDIFDNEFFDPNLYQVFRKDRDAVKRSLRCASVRLCNEDSILDQLCVSLIGADDTI